MGEEEAMEMGNERMVSVLSLQWAHTHQRSEIYDMPKGVRFVGEGVFLLLNPFSHLSEEEIHKETVEVSFKETS